MIRILLLALLLAGCGRFHRVNGYYYNDSFEKEMQSYMKSKDTYMGYKEAHYNIIVHFKALMPPKIGTCHGETAYDALGKIVERKRIIQIDPLSWYTMNDTKREILIFHELGHCDLNLDHTNFPSIMSSKILNQYFYEAARDQFIEQLFVELLQ